MEPINVFGLACLACVVLLTVRFLSHGLDRGRLQKWLRSRGCRLLSCEWEPFVTTWLPAVGTVYLVRFVDADGREHVARAHVLMLYGIFLREDRVAGVPGPGVA